MDKKPEAIWNHDDDITSRIIAFSHLACNIADAHKVAPGPIVHGTRCGYSEHKCRCELCTTAQREYMRKWRGK